MKLFFCFFLEIATSTLPTAIVHKPYKQDPIIALGPSRCPQNNLHFRLAFGQLPPGLQLTSSGYLTGTPTQTGTYQFLVRAGNDCEYTTRPFTLKVEGAPIFVTFPDSLDFEYTPNGPIPTPQTVLVSSSWPDMPYSIDPIGATWLSADPLRGRTQLPDGPHSGDPVAISIDPAKLTPGTYRATLRISAWQATNSPTIPVTLRVR
ncbi:MAG: putative Ig domain-containing protein [Acidobacteria bacterium]|nr:putative Ig domain-containing protein [Acidobacteriota bacterium]